ncbi:diphthamide synthase domain-containing protein [Ditylenchus destructor]|nr:diphthamide synthase domain-containing protein [Ditylenchus destructor]
MIYTKENGDEVEDLRLLMTKIQEKYRDVKGVSVGAINSTYQKERVKNVIFASLKFSTIIIFQICERFGIVPLCLLWERNRLEMLDEMIGSGLNAILIKVAGMGLNSGHLSKNLRELRLMKQKDPAGVRALWDRGNLNGASLKSCIETLVQSSVQTATQSFDSRTQTNLFEQCKTVIEAEIQFFFAVKDSVGNPKAVGMHSIVGESAEQLAIAVGDLQRIINLLDSDAGGIHGVVDSISRSISLADQTRQTHFVNCARDITSTIAALIHAVKKLDHSDK